MLHLTGHLNALFLRGILGELLQSACLSRMSCWTLPWLQSHCIVLKAPLVEGCLPFASSLAGNVAVVREPENLESSFVVVQLFATWLRGMERVRILKLISWT